MRTGDTGAPALVKQAGACLEWSQTDSRGSMKQYRSHLLRSIVMAVATLSLSLPAVTALAWDQPADAGPRGAGARKGKEKPGEATGKGDKGKPGDTGKGKPGDKGEHAAGANQGKPGDKGKPEHAGKDAPGQAGEGGAVGAPVEGDADERVNRGRQQASERRARRAERAKKLRDEARGKASRALKGQPMEKAFQQELERHARRVARLERIHAVAAEAGDGDSIERAEKLIDKEKERHERWMSTYAEKGAGAQ